MFFPYNSRVTHTVVKYAQNRARIIHRVTGWSANEQKRVYIYIVYRY